MDTKGDFVTLTSQYTEDSVQNPVFLPWSRDNAVRQMPMSTARHIPRSGFAAIAGSSFTTVLSLAVLLVVDHREVWPQNSIYRFMQPASWLSALLSANTILLHIAMTEGVAITWWYKAIDRRATLESLHEVWVTGNSTASVLRSWRRFTNISLATLCIAILPLNGFILQGAISTPLWIERNEASISIPIARTLPLGYSGWYDGNSVDLVSAFGLVWEDVWQQVVNPTGSSYLQYAFFGSLDRNGSALDLGYDNSSTYIARVAGAGFNVTCIPSKIPFDLEPTINQSGQPGRVFSSSFSWDPKSPNTIDLDLLWKLDSGCSGNFEVRHCTLDAATVEYPVQVQMNISSP